MPTFNYNTQRNTLFPPVEIRVIKMKFQHDFKVSIPEIGNAYFEILLQPIVTVKNNAIVAYEVLSSIIQETGECINNESFFEKATELTMYNIIENQIIALNKCHDIKKTYSINMPLSFLYFNSIIMKLYQSQFNCVIEITSIDCSTSSKFIRNRINDLKKSGISFWLDDFTNRCDIQNNALADIDWDFVKIDKSITQSSNSLDIELTMEKLRENKIRNVIWEGIENNPDSYISQLNYSSQDLAQGFFFGLPKRL
ncbi:EAL domain-containing protein [Vibrio rotiferianus]|uniref:EAL domain-containing protein n=1 Tax=Vibrio rotiferianus TaxID=190895 RepID=UPI003909D49E